MKTNETERNFMNSNPSVLHVEASEGAGALDAIDASNGATSFIHVQHREGSSERVNLTQVARHNPDRRDLLVGLAARGFYGYVTDDYITRYVHERRLNALWNPLKSGEYSMSAEGVVYSYTAPTVDLGNTKLLVIFSAMNAPIYSSSLMRYFAQNFSTAQKYITPETAILRISDVGGVVGNFYMNTSYHLNNVENIQKLIKKISISKNIMSLNIVLYGTSKGGTAALYHGLIGDYKSISVDPVVSDHHYVELWSDSHFTVNSIFIETKESLFRRTVSEYLENCKNIEPEVRNVVICSKRSPQYKYIEQILIDPLISRLSFFNVDHPGILDHPDVGPKSLPITTMIINSLLYGIDIKSGLTTVV
ncbi:XcbB/CpsF family capsular polysaccharide biosynthesis protein [Paeniglutamicibacter cryotolerans]|uniref:XcbB/CpsF family capsular polysaccharide biosynthesis protein n=1 Tax=Paeniglutamicibacter cryotolerans TaxID=670079 RepID=A0A839QMJ4_9MICC|nr:XcbB/CpsF family capsular polysaccharide biosynthesis protein [Paeniglutamicibacter cryotolerans]MBB2997469.1 hypothetical protein [Paeniglutamicibacter cryotolerans]